MDRKILLAADETIICPQCDHHFPLDQGIAQQTIERYRTEMETALEAQRKALEQQVGAEAERQAAKKYNEKIGQLDEKLKDSQDALQHAKAAVRSAQEQASASAKAEFEEEKKLLLEQAEKKDAALRAFREQEMALRKQKADLEEARQNLELDMQRKLDEQRQQLQVQISSTEAERFRLKEAELRKKIEDAQRANEDLTRKLEQGSQQLQGEVLELALEQMLTQSFPHDRIDEVKKGVRGADVLQTVCNQSAQDCGVIIWEAKRAEHWSDKWLQKLKSDQQQAGADIAVLVTTSMPKGNQEPFCRIGDVWVVTPQAMRPLAETLRVLLLEANRLRLVASGRNEKMELIYSYLASAQFAQTIRSMLDGFESMRKDLEAEKRSMLKMWAKREMQISMFSGSTAAVVGQLQAIAQGGLPQLDTIEMLSLPGEGDGDGDELAA